MSKNTNKSSRDQHLSAPLNLNFWNPNPLKQFYNIELWSYISYWNLKKLALQGLVRLAAAVVGPSNPGLENDSGERGVRNLDRGRRRGWGQDEGWNCGGEFKLSTGSGKKI